MFKTFLPFYFKTKRREFLFSEPEIKHLNDIINGKIWFRQRILGEDKIGYNKNVPVIPSKLQTNNPLQWANDEQANYSKKLFLNAIELKVITKIDLEKKQDYFSPPIDFNTLTFN